MTDATVPPSGWRGYVEVLRRPGAAAFSASGALARLPMAMVGLGSLLLLTGLGRSYTLAGLVDGTMLLAQGLCSPLIGRLADRYGQTRVLLPGLVVHAGVLAGLILAAQFDAPGWLLVALAVPVGASFPQIGSFARARWSALLPGDRRVDAGLAIESLIDEAVFIVGPVLVTTLATSVAPAAGLVTALVVVVIGCGLFLAQRRTEPAPHPVTADRPARAWAITQPGLAVLAGAFFGIGAVFGLVQVGVVGLARHLHHPGATGIVLALWATGSLLAGAVYGSVTWRRPARRRFLYGVAGLAAGTVLVGATARTLPTLIGALVVAGLANAPTLITGNVLVPLVVPAEVVTEAYTWLSVTILAGVSVGSPVGGVLIDRVGPVGALWASTGAGLLALVVTAAGQRWLNPPVAHLRAAPAADQKTV